MKPLRSNSVSLRKVLDIHLEVFQLFSREYCLFPSLWVAIFRSVSRSMHTLRDPQPRGPNIGKGQRGWGWSWRWKRVWRGGSGVVSSYPLSTLACVRTHPFRSYTPLLSYCASKPSQPGVWLTRAGQLVLGNNTSYLPRTPYRRQPASHFSLFIYYRIQTPSLELPEGDGGIPFHTGVFLLGNANWNWQRLGT